LDHISRRLFLGATGVGVGALVLGEAPAGAVPVTALNRSTFTPLVGATAIVSGPSGRFRAVLEQVSDLPAAVKSSERQFSLLFRPVAVTQLPDGIYTVSHAKLGNRQLFLARVDRGSHLRFQAIVNQLAVPTARPAVVRRRFTGVVK
jgi:hypothetical protein